MEPIKISGLSGSSARNLAILTVLLSLKLGIPVFTYIKSACFMGHVEMTLGNPLILSAVGREMRLSLFKLHLKSLLPEV